MHIALGEAYRPSQIRVGTTIEVTAEMSPSGATLTVRSPCCHTRWSIKVPEYTYVRERGWALDRVCSSCTYRYAVSFPQDEPLAVVRAKGDGPGRDWRKAR